MTIFSPLWQLQDYISTLLLAILLGFILQDASTHPLYGVTPAKLAVFMPIATPHSSTIMLKTLASHPLVDHLDHMPASKNLLSEKQRLSLLTMLKKANPKLGIPDTIILHTSAEHVPVLTSFLEQQFSMKPHVSYDYLAHTYLFGAICTFVVLFAVFSYQKVQQLRKLSTVLADVGNSSARLRSLLHNFLLKFWLSVLSLSALGALYAIPLSRVLNMLKIGTAAPLISLIVLTFFVFGRTIDHYSTRFS